MTHCINYSFWSASNFMFLTRLCLYIFDKCSIFYLMCPRTRGPGWHSQDWKHFGITFKLLKIAFLDKPNTTLPLCQTIPIHKKVMRVRLNHLPQLLYCPLVCFDIFDLFSLYYLYRALLAALLRALSGLKTIFEVIFQLQYHFNNLWCL